MKQIEISGEMEERCRKSIFSIFLFSANNTGFVIFEYCDDIEIKKVPQNAYKPATGWMRDEERLLRHRTKLVKCSVRLSWAMGKVDGPV